MVEARGEGEEEPGAHSCFLKEQASEDPTRNQLVAKALGAHGPYVLIEPEGDG